MRSDKKELSHGASHLSEQGIFDTITPVTMASNPPPPPPPPQQQPSGGASSGLGHSTPLVRVGGAASVGIRPAAAASLPRPPPPPMRVDHHPLAIPASPPGVQPTTVATLPTPPPSTPMTPPPVVVPKQTDPSASFTAASRAPIPAVAVSSAASPSVRPQSPVKKSLDSLADAFLSGPSYRLEQKLAPLLVPPKLSLTDTGMVRLRTLVERRAWGDVLQVCGDMLRKYAPHAPIYEQLLSQDDTATPTTVAEDDETVLRQETMEILMLECHAWLKLRRYADLGREVDRWWFCFVNDSTAVAPPWVPWSLRE